MNKLEIEEKLKALRHVHGSQLGFIACRRCAERTTLERLLVGPLVPPSSTGGTQGPPNP